MADREIILDKEALKTIAADTRITILKTLHKRNHTQTELAEKLGLSVPTIKEHLETLHKQEFVLRKEERRKWKYYTLTERGRALLDPEGQRVLVLLGITGFAVTGGIFGVAKQLIARGTAQGGEQQTMVFDGAELAIEAKRTAVTNVQAPVQTTTTASIAAESTSGTLPETAGAHEPSYVLIALILYCSIIVILLLLTWYYYQKSKKNSELLQKAAQQEQGKFKRKTKKSRKKTAISTKAQ